MTPDDKLILSACSLASKWGFGDGDLISDFIHENFDEEIDKGVNLDKFLFFLVSKYLLPKIKADITIQEIETCHNPVIIFEINGKQIDYMDISITYPDLEGIFVEISKDQLLKDIEEFRT